MGKLLLRQTLRSVFPVIKCSDLVPFLFIALLPHPSENQLSIFDLLIGPSLWFMLSDVTGLIHMDFFPPHLPFILQLSPELDIANQNCPGKLHMP